MRAGASRRSDASAEPACQIELAELNLSAKQACYLARNDTGVSGAEISASSSRSTGPRPSGG